MHRPEDPTDTPTAGWSRRGFLSAGGTGLGLAALLAACAKSEEPQPVAQAGGALTQATTPEQVIDDATLLRTASSVALLAAELHDQVVDSPHTTPELTAAARLFARQHREHASAFQTATTRAGGQAFQEPNAAMRANVVTPGLEAVDGTDALIQLVHQVETIAAATYQSMVPLLTTAQLRSLIMSVGGVAARHAALLAGLVEDAVTVGGLGASGDGGEGGDEGGAAAGEDSQDTEEGPDTSAAGGGGGDEEVPIAQVPGAFGSVAESLGPNSYVYAT